MKSLAEREAFREKQKAAEAKQRDTSPVSQTDGEGTPKAEEKFDAAGWLDDSADNINANLKDLTDDELSEIEKSETKGKKRNSVTAAIKKEKDSRVNKGSNWNPNNA